LRARVPPLAARAQSLAAAPRVGLPSLDGVEEVVISKEVVEGAAQPLYIYADFEPIEGTSAHEQDVGGVDLQEFLLRMLVTPKVTFQTRRPN